MRKILTLTLLICFVNLAFSQDDSKNFTKNLIAHLPFDDDAKDHSGNNNHGNEYGCKLAPDRFGYENKAFAFDGKDDYIRIENDESLNFGLNDFSVSVWLKFGSQKGGTDDYASIFIKSKIDHPWEGMLLFVDQPSSGNIEFRLTHEGDNKLHSNRSNLNTNEWVHLVLIRQNHKLKMYKNGVLEMIYKVMKTDISNDQPLWLGCNHVSIIRQNFGGIMDDLRIYNVAIDEFEIERLFKFIPEEKELINAVRVKSKKVTVKIWDEAREDGDIVSVFLNDTRIKKELTVKKSEYVFTLELEEGINTFRLLAHNEGENPPNTAALLIDDGAEEHKRVLSSKKDEFAELQIVFE